MICVILAAGYATRLYPLTENFPKPLLDVNGKTILDWLVDDIDASGKITGYIVISNHRYFEHFSNWASEKPQKITVLDDLTESNETRLGAVLDIQFAIEKLGLCDDLLVIAGDNVLDFSLCSFIDYFFEKNASVIMRYYEENTARLQKSGVVETDENDKILSMEEKPENPKSNWCCPPFYIYKKTDVPMVEKGISAGCGTDAPGSFIAWLSQNTDAYAMEMPGKRYDIGSIESYELVKASYGGIVNG